MKASHFSISHWQTHIIFIYCILLYFIAIYLYDDQTPLSNLVIIPPSWSIEIQNPKDSKDEGNIGTWKNQEITWVEIHFPTGSAHGIGVNPLVLDKPKNHIGVPVYPTVSSYCVDKSTILWRIFDITWYDMSISVLHPQAHCKARRLEKANSFWIDQYVLLGTVGMYIYVLYIYIYIYTLYHTIYICIHILYEYYHIIYIWFCIWHM